MAKQRKTQKASNFDLALIQVLLDREVSRMEREGTDLTGQPASDGYKLSVIALRRRVQRSESITYRFFPESQE